MATAGVHRPRVFLEVSEGTEPLGRIVIELFADQAPKTCENFRALCAGTKPPLTYKMSSFHRIIDEFMIQGGDITKGDGTGGESIYGGEFEDENLDWRELDKEGLVCMANRGKATNTSQFFITLAPCEHLNGKHTVFGRVVSGQPILEKLGKVDVDKNDRPLVEIIISRCGELERRKPATANNATATTDIGRTEKRDDERRRKKRAHSSHSTSSRSRSPEDHLPAPIRQHRSPRTTEHTNNGPAWRRSDHAIDEDMRGGKRHASRHRDSRDQFKKTSRQDRKRSASPSRAAERRGSRSRSPEEYRRRKSPPIHYERRGGPPRYHQDEQRIREEEIGRDGGRDRFTGVMQESRASRWTDSRDGRLNSGGRVGDGASEIKFKGRGAMKFRERK